MRHAGHPKRPKPKSAWLTLLDLYYERAVRVNAKATAIRLVDDAARPCVPITCPPMKEVTIHGTFTWHDPALFHRLFWGPTHTEVQRTWRVCRAKARNR